MSKIYLSKNGKVHLLEGHNYTSWKSSMITAFKCFGCWEIVEGTTEAPDYSDAAEFRKLDKIAKRTIELACGDAVRPHICNAETSEAAWDQLKDRYDTLCRPNPTWTLLFILCPVRGTLLPLCLSQYISFFPRGFMERIRPDYSCEIPITGEKTY
jgi:hypothetical protein